jgi:hypothetical protein
MVNKENQICNKTPQKAAIYASVLAILSRPMTIKLLFSLLVVLPVLPRSILSN